MDVLHSPANFGPLGGPFARVLTVHDVGFATHPELLAPPLRATTRALVTAAAHRAQRLLTVSVAARDDIVRELRIPPSRIDVHPNGVEAPGQGDAARARARLGAGDRPIVLSVAADLPHKNLAGLVRATAAIAADERPLLALVGHGTDRSDAIRGTNRDDVRALGALPADALEDLYAAAGVVATLTRYEGFGLPVLEALARGVPVVCSDLPVLREVSGGSVTFVDPDRPQEVAAALSRVLHSPPRVDAGHARRFTWEAAARATLRSYEAALASRGPRRRRTPSP